MANSTTNLDLISSSQAQKEITSNALSDAFSPISIGGRRASTSGFLQWGYYGGNIINSSGTISTISNGTLTLNAAATNYIEMNKVTGVISSNISGFTVSGFAPLYTVVTGVSTVTSYTDFRAGQNFGGGGGGGGLVNFTDTLNNTSPNAAKPVCIFSAANAAMVADLAIVPKGDGALLAQVPDATSAGGNKRGTYAVDFQRIRGNANQVAGGQQSFIVAGQNNRADGTFSGVAGGYNNYTSDYTAGIFIGQNNKVTGSSTSAAVFAGSNNEVQTGSDSAGVFCGYGNVISSTSSGAAIVCGLNNVLMNSTYSFIAGGTANNTNNSTYCFTGTGNSNIMFNGSYSFIGSGTSNEARSGNVFIGGGNINKCTGYSSSILNGNLCTADSQYSFAAGLNAHTKGIVRSDVWSCGNFNGGASDGKVQKRYLQLRGKTASSSSIDLTADTGGAGSSNQVTFATNESKVIKGTGMIVDQTTNATLAAYSINVIARNTAGTVTILLNTITADYIDAAATTAGFALVASVDAGNLAVKFTASKTSGNDIASMVDLKITELNY